PEAAHVVFRSGAPLTMVGLDVTTATCLTLEDLDALTAAGSAAARFVRRICTPWIRLVRAPRGIAGCWLHDPLALARALARAGWHTDALAGAAARARSVVPRERMAVGGELRGATTYGQTAAARPGMGGGIRAPRGGPVDVCTAVDDARFMARLGPALRGALKG